MSDNPTNRGDSAETATPIARTAPSKPATSTPDATRRSDRARTAILSATRELIAENGYAKLSIEGIAAAAGVGKQTIYRWWPSRAAVVFDAILDANSHHGSIALPDTGDLEADLRLVLRSTVAELADPVTDRLQRAILAEIQTDLTVADELLRRLLRPQMEATAARIRSGIAAGQVNSTTDADLAAEMLFGPIFHRWLLRTGAVDQEFADSALALALTGLRPR